MQENLLYIYRIKDTTINEKTNKAEYTLSKEHIRFDKGMAFYHSGFTNQYVLIGLLRSIMTEPQRSEILQTSLKLGDVFVIGNQGMVAVWTGTWEPLERMGLISCTFNTRYLENCINEVFRNVEEHGGELVDR